MCPATSFSRAVSTGPPVETGRFHHAKSCSALRKLFIYTYIYMEKEGSFPGFDRKIFCELNARGFGRDNTFSKIFGRVLNLTGNRMEDLNRC